MIWCSSRRVAPWLEDRCQHDSTRPQRRWPRLAYQFPLSGIRSIFRGNPSRRVYSRRGHLTRTGTAANFVRCRVVHRKEAAAACHRRPGSAMAPLQGRRRQAAALPPAADPAGARAGLDRARVPSRDAACRRSASQKEWMKRYATRQVTAERIHMRACILCVGLDSAWRPVPGYLL